LIVMVPKHINIVTAFAGLGRPDIKRVELYENNAPSLLLIPEETPPHHPT